MYIHIPHPTTLRRAASAAALAACLMTACSSAGGSRASAGEPSPEPTAAQSAPADTLRFDADSALAYIKAQVDRGPRVPGSKAHTQTGDYLVSTLRRLGADTVIEQRATATAWDGHRLPLRNILARFNPASTGRRILLVAHWDTRPWADNDPDPARRDKPIDGANDGASGVGILLEIARLIGERPAAEPVDILLVDGEDYGAPDDTPGADETSWCLGTQQWIPAMPYDFSTQPRYALLLDMVGGRDARFPREALSSHFAPDVVDRVWRRAASLGMADRFPSTAGGIVVDDHLFLNRAGIPAIDIIESAHEATGSFNPTWHTHDDTFDNLDPATIACVGRLVESVVYDRP